MYERFLNQLKQYAQAIRALSKGYLPISLFITLQIKPNTTRGKTSSTDEE